MSKDDLEFFRRLKGFQPTSNALDLLKGIEQRKLGLIKKNVTIREDLELFAEEQLVKKKDFDEMVSIDVLRFPLFQKLSPEL